MKTIRALVLGSLICSAGLFAADTMNPSLRGVLSLGGEKKFNLADETAAQSAWLSVGESFQGWKVESYRQKDEVLVLRKDGKSVELALANSQVKEGKPAQTSTQATLADAEALIRKMNFESMIEKTLQQQKKSGVQMAKQMALKGGMNPANAKEFEELQNKIMDTLFSPELVEGMKSDLTKAYSELFTKEELQGLSDFYGTALGQSMTDKQPLLQQKLMESMGPRMMANMGKVQQLTQEFQQQMKAKAEAAKAAAAAPTAATQPGS